MPAVVLQRGVLSPDAFEALRRAVVDSPMVGRTTLNGPFQATRGFGVTFHGGGRGQLVKRMPELGAYLDRVLGAPAVNAMRRWYQRIGRPAPNAWYLNVLMVPPGAGVGRHLDVTLRKPSGVPEAMPSVVTVLYLEVPAAAGGELVLSTRTRVVGSVKPQPGLVVHFDGSLHHEVETFEGPPSSRRVSVVIEQYHFEPGALARLSEFHLESRAAFEAYLQAHAKKALPPFELEP